MPSTFTSRLEGLTTSVAVKAPCRVATTAPIQLSGLQTINGVAVSSGDRILVKDQASKVDNGIWLASVGSWTRAADFDGSLDAVGGTQVITIEGDLHGNRYWRIIGVGDVTIGRDEVEFVSVPFNGIVKADSLTDDPGELATIRDKLGLPTILLEDYGAVGDGVTDDEDAFLAAIDAANALFTSSIDGIGGARIIGKPGKNYAFSGRIRLKPGAHLDLGRGGSGCSKLIILSTTGGIELVGGTSLTAELRATVANYVGPAVELDGNKANEGGMLSFGRNERQCWFDVGIRCDRQAGSTGLRMAHDTGGQGVAWVVGRADIGETDIGVEIESTGTGYINENWLDLRIYDAVEAVKGIVNDTGEIAANRIRLTHQTGANGRAGRLMTWDGRASYIEVESWDWTTARLDPSYDGTQILLTDKSGGNRLYGRAARGLTGTGFAKPAVVDLAPQIRRNFVEVDDQRIIAPSARPLLPVAYENRAMVGDQDDELAFAADGRWSVANSGTTPISGGNEVYMFRPGGQATSVASATEAICTVDFGAEKTGGDYHGIGLIFSSLAGRPDKVKVESSVNGSDWLTVLSAGYDGGEVPIRLTRMDGGGLSNFRYLRLTAENDSAKTVGIARWFLAGNGAGHAGAWLAKYRPAVLDSVYVNGTKVLGAQQTAIPDASGGTEVTTINAVLAAMRAHGLIAT